MQERKEKDRKKEQEARAAAEAKKLRRRARRMRNKERNRRRETQEDVSSISDDTEDADERGRDDAHKLTVTGGEILSDETWEDTCSEISYRSVNPRIAPAPKIRLFEWAYVWKPSSVMPADFTFERFPAPLAYTSMKLVTMQTGEKVTLPGMRYPVGVEPDFVPILDPLVRSAARHGHTIGLLAHAVIEPATSWALRTTVQGWNGHMYFSLPSSNGNAGQLDSWYRKWNRENTRLLHPTPGAADVKADRTGRFARRNANKRKMVSELYETSLWRPLALGFMPAYLDWEPDMEDTYLQNPELSIVNLFYVRFPGCDLPHYCFWVRKGEWSDPTTPDPAWNPDAFDAQNTNHEKSITSTLPPKGRVKSKDLISPPLDSSESLAHVKSNPTLLSLEHDLLTCDLAATLTKLRNVAIASGKVQAWSIFTSKLTALYPSGNMPHAPPTEPMQGMCVAEIIIALLSGQDPMPLEGKESWTRNDANFWDAASTNAYRSDRSPQIGYPQPVDASHTPCSLSNSPIDDSNACLITALNRRSSSPSLSSSKNQNIWTWLDNISSPDTPRLAPISPSHLSTQFPLFCGPISPLDLNRTDTVPTCPFCNVSWQWFSDLDKAAHMLSHSHVSSPPVTVASRINVVGVGVKRRHSLLSVRTLTSYHTKAGKGRKMLRVDSASSSMDGWAKLGTVESPFSREARVAKKRKWTFGRAKKEPEDARGWFGDDERGL